jgi:hypothetical protein
MPNSTWASSIISHQLQDIGIVVFNFNCQLFEPSMEALSILALTLYPMKIYQTTAKLLGFLASVVLGQHALTQEFPWIADDKIARIDAKWTEEKIQIDGILDEKAWLECAPSRKFVDLISGEETAYSTTVKLLWDNENLYVAYDIEEPNVQGKFTERDSPIYQDNDVEIFIAGENAYYEFEINSLGTIYEGLFVWQSDFEKSGLAQLKELDRNNPALRFQEFNGVGFTKHPRGKRWAFLGWDYAGARSAVAVQGTLNDGRTGVSLERDEVAQLWQTACFASESQRSMANRFLKVQSVQGASTAGRLWRMGVEPSWDLGFPYSGILPVCEVLQAVVESGWRRWRRWTGILILRKLQRGS